MIEHVINRMKKAVMEEQTIISLQGRIKIWIELLEEYQRSEGKP